MAMCERIRTVARPHEHMLQSIASAGTMEERKAIGNQLTSKIAAGIRQMGFNAKQVGTDLIEFDDGIIYDVIKNLSGLGMFPEISCHVHSHGIYGDPPEESEGQGGSGGDPVGGGGFPAGGGFPVGSGGKQGGNGNGNGALSILEKKVTLMGQEIPVLYVLVGIVALFYFKNKK